MMAARAWDQILVRQREARAIKWQSGRSERLEARVAVRVYDVSFLSTLSTVLCRAHCLSLSRSLWSQVGLVAPNEAGRHFFFGARRTSPFFMYSSRIALNVSCGREGKNRFALIMTVC